MAGGALWTGYVGWHLLSVTVTVAVGAWVATHTEVDGRLSFVALMAGDTVWVLGSLGAITLDGSLAIGATYLRDLASLLVPFVWLYFAATYTRRSTSLRLDSSPNPVLLATLVGALSMALLLLTNPWHGLFWTDLVRHEVPFGFYETVSGPVGTAATLLGGIPVVLGLYYLGELFVASRHRTSASVFVLSVAGVAAAVPFVLERAGATPAPGLNHIAMGVLPFVVAASYGIFGLGVFDIAPVARATLLDHVDDAMFVLGGGGAIVDYNPAAEEFLDPPEGVDPIGRPISAVGPTLAAALGPVRSTERERRQISYAPDARERHFSVTVSPIVEEETVVGRAVLLREVTELVRYQRRLERENERLDEFASVVSHDLRNPLAVVLGSLELAEETGETEHLQRSRTAAERMEELVDDLLAMAREGETVTETQPVDLRLLAERSWATVETPAATLRTPTDAVLEADAQRVRQLLENLFRNAVEHSSTSPGSQAHQDAVEHGSTSPQQAADAVEHGSSDVTVTVGDIRGADETGFYVEDDGPGIPVDERARVFESRYSNAPEGNGLGLSIVRQIVEAHGWAIRVTEGAAGGARFEVTGVDHVRRSDSGATVEAE